MRWLAGDPPEQATPETSHEGLAEAIGTRSTSSEATMTLLTYDAGDDLSD